MKYSNCILQVVLNRLGKFQDSIVNARNANFVAERFVKSAGREALDFFLLISEKQIRGIPTEYIDYYNTLRAHQGIDQNIPQGYKPQDSGLLCIL